MTCLRWFLILVQKYAVDSSIEIPRKSVLRPMIFTETTRQCWSQNKNPNIVKNIPKFKITIEQPVKFKFSETFGAICLKFFYRFFLIKILSPNFWDSSCFENFCRILIEFFGLTVQTELPLFLSSQYYSSKVPWNSDYSRYIR